MSCGGTGLSVLSLPAPFVMECGYAAGGPGVDTVNVLAGFEGET